MKANRMTKAILDFVPHSVIDEDEMTISCNGMKVKKEEELLTPHDDSLSKRKSCSLLAGDHRCAPIKKKRKLNSLESNLKLKDISSGQCASKSKYQNQYKPAIPMTKDQEAEWRLEARRKRNRNSAAVSRKKVRSRITELEQEVQEWKSKYDSLYQKVHDMGKILRCAMPSVEPLSPEDTNHAYQITPTSFDNNEEDIILVSPGDSPNIEPIQPPHIIPESFSIGTMKSRNSSLSHDGSDVVTNQHINEFVSRQA